MRIEPLRQQNYFYTEMKKQKIDFIDFLRTGEFGPIKMGAHRDEVEDALGKGNWFEAAGDMTKTLTYCNIEGFEFYFQSNQLNGIVHGYIQDYDDNFDPDFNTEFTHFYFESWLEKTSDLQFNNVLKKLNELEFEFEINPFYDTIQITLKSSIHLQFRHKDQIMIEMDELPEFPITDPGWKLAAFYYSIPIDYDNKKVA